MTIDTAAMITTPTEREVHITRIFDAPRTLVFRAFTQPEVLKRWLEAPGRTMSICEIDLRAGGAYRWVWSGPGKRDVGMRGVYREVTAPERFVRTEAWEDWDAGEVLVTTVFEEQDGKTKLASIVLFPTQAVRDEVLKSGLQRGTDENFSRLAELLESTKSEYTGNQMNKQGLQVSTPTDREIVMTRTFNAPRRLVFAAMTKPEFMKQWLFGPDGWTFETCEIDLRAGGRYRYVWLGPDGSEMGMSGTIREVVPPERVVQTEKFDMYPNEAVGTLVLLEEAGKTNLTLTMQYDSKETRDAALKSGMEHGMAAGYDRLEALLPSFV